MSRRSKTNCEGQAGDAGIGMIVLWHEGNFEFYYYSILSLASIVNRQQRCIRSKKFLAQSQLFYDLYLFTSTYTSSQFLPKRGFFPSTQPGAIK